MIFFVLLAAMFVVLSQKYVVYEQHDINITQALHAQVDSMYIDKHLSQALAEKKFDDVVMYQNLAKMLHIAIGKKLQERIALENSFSHKSIRNIKDFANGFFSGTSTSMVGLGGSITSDMTLYGDLRDIKQQGRKYFNGEPYDSFVLQISLVGLGLSAGQLLSGGAATSLKVGASMIKVAKKSGKLSKPFLSLLGKRLNKSVDTKVLKSLIKNAKNVEKSIDVRPLKGIFKELGGIKSATSTVDTIALMKYVDTTKDLRKINRLSRRYTSNTRGIMKVLGKRVFKTTKGVLKVTGKIADGMLGLTLSLLGAVWMLLVQIFSNIFMLMGYIVRGAPRKYGL